MSNHAHRRPRENRTVVRPRTFVRTATGSLLPAIPVPLYIGLGRVKCIRCDRRFWRLQTYRRHFVVKHIYGEVLGG